MGYWNANMHIYTFNQLADFRHSSDYGDFIYMDPEEVRVFEPLARAFVFEMKRLVDMDE